MREPPNADSERQGTARTRLHAQFLPDAVDHGRPHCCGNGITLMPGIREVCLAVTACLGLAAVAHAAEAATDQPSTCAVIGDVLRANTYRCPAWQPLTLRDAVTAAGMISESANVLVVRSAQSQQWTETISRRSADPGPPLRPGDVVIVQALGPADTQVAQNAAIVAHGRPVVLSLQPSGQVPVAVGDVLTSCQLPPEAAMDLRLISSRPGRSRQELQPGQPVEHGDLFVLGTLAGRPQRSRARFAPMVTEWAPPAALVPSASEPGPAPATTTIPPATPGTPDTTTDPALSAGTMPTGTVDAPADGSLPGHAGGPLLIPPMSPDPNTLPATSVDPFRTVSSHSDDQLPAEPADMAVSRLATANLSEDDADAGSLIREMAPFEDEAGVPAAKATSFFSLSNITFMAGLLLAAALIVFGWLRSEAELRTSQSRTVIQSVVKDDEAHRPTQSTPVEHVGSIPELPETHAAAAPDPGTAGVLATPFPASPAPATAALVATHEWVGGDWLQPASAAAPFAAVAVAVQSDAHVAIDRWSASVAVPSSHAAPVAASTEAVPPAVPMSLEDPGSREVADGSVNVTETMAGVTPLQESTAPAATFQDLTDLVENRLPSDLCQVVLPLQVALYGRPAGPRRLRIDAAHPQLAGPHLPRSGERRPQTVAAAPASSIATDYSPATDLLSKSPMDDARPTSADAPVPSGSLDRALHFLNEQGP
jgi:hypothetical protein